MWVPGRYGFPGTPNYSRRGELPRPRPPVLLTRPERERERFAGSPRCEGPAQLWSTHSCSSPVLRSVEWGMEELQPQERCVATGLEGGTLPVQYRLSGT